MGLILQLFANGLVNGALYTLLAIGFGLVFRSMGIFHLAYGAVYVFAPYMLYTFMVNLNWSLMFSLVMAIGLAGLFGYFMERVVYRPFYYRSASSSVVLIASLGIYIVVENLIALVYGNEVKILSKGIEPSVNIGQIILTRIQIVQLLVGLGLGLLFIVMVKKTKLFKLIWAMGEEPELIQVLGLPLFRLRTIVMVLSSIAAAVASCLTALDIGVDPHVGMSALLIAAVAVIVGGVESYIGWIAGSFVLAELQSLVIWKFSARWVDLITFGLLILILLTRPQGLLGMRKRVEEV